MMDHDRIRTILTAASLITLMAAIGWFMHGLFVPDPIYAKPPAYTQQYVNELQREKIYYEKGYKEITEILDK